MTSGRSVNFGSLAETHHDPDGRASRSVITGFVNAPATADVADRFALHDQTRIEIDAVPP